MRIDSLSICEGVFETIFEKASTQIVDALFNAMRPHYVKRQVIHTATEASLFGCYRADLHEFSLEDSEAEEPVS